MNLVPPLLSPGDKISIIAPAGNIKQSQNLANSLKVISDMGFQVSYPFSGWPGKAYLADSDKARAAEFARAWKDPETKCVWALRGGYGSLRMIDHIDFSLIENNPKYFIGFSDITILLNQITIKTGLVTMHGPVVSSLADTDRETITRVAACLKEDLFYPLDYRAEIIRKGPTVTGRLLGGNLCSLVSLLGTQYQPDYSGSVLFLEDVNEPVYKIDRMLTQLFMNGALDNLRGIVLGDFSNTDEKSQEEDIKTSEFTGKRLTELVRNEIPIWTNLSAGHCRKNLALPVGASVTMENRTRRLIFKTGPDDDN